MQTLDVSLKRISSVEQIHGCPVNDTGDIDCVLRKQVSLLGWRKYNVPPA